MKKPKTMLELMLDAAQNTGDIMLRYQYQKDMIKQGYFDRMEREAWKKEIAADVLSRISATVDVSEVVQEIEQLRKELEHLYDMFE